MDAKRIMGMALLGLAVIIAGMVGFQSGEEEVGDNSPYFWLGQGRTGILKSIDKNEAVLSVGNSTLTFEINQKTKFTTRGTPGVPVVGSTVQIHYGVVGNHNVARQVRLLKLAEGAGSSATATPKADESPEASEAPGAASATPAAASHTPLK